MYSRKSVQTFDRHGFAKMIRDRQEKENLSLPELARKLGLGRTTMSRLRTASGALPNVTTYLAVLDWLQSPRPIEGGTDAAMDVGCIQYGK